MVICPNCRAENRSGAKFCKNCATRLPTSSAVTRPLDLETMRLDKANLSASAQNSQTTRRLAQNPRTDTRPLPPANVFDRRPPGAVFGDNFIFENVIFSDDHRHHYLVRQIDVPEDLQIRTCPNASCGAIFLPRNAAPEKFCTDCGTVLEKGGKDLALIEERTPIPDNLVRLAAKGLSHGAVRAPLAAFVERLAGQSRHCMVVPRVGALEGLPDSMQALHWGIGLARGLDYLHDNGVSFNGRVDPKALGVVNGRAVWAYFTSCSHHPEGYVTERKPDAEALARLIFYWLTGKERLEHDPNLAPAISQVFERVYTSPGIASAGELAELLSQALEEMTSAKTLDYFMGRRTHVGMVRNLNEDSLLTVEINRIHQSISQPVGVYVVADGMGGHAAGEIASGAIINTISQKAFKELMPAQFTKNAALDRQKWLREAVEEANAEVFKLRRSAGTDMGSTLVSALLEGNKAYIAHIGDSRAYLINSQGIQRLTTDHSLVERLIATNQITREEARHHPQRNVIYRTIGDKPKIDVEVTTHTLKVGDCLLLCSDGLSGMVEDEAIYQIVMNTPSPQAACDALIEAANAAGGDDNISVVIVKIVEA